MPALISISTTMKKPDYPGEQRVLLLNGSPRPNGLVSQWIEALDTEARTAGFTTEALTISSLNVSPCTGCMRCRSTNHCVLPDDGAQHVLQAMQAADIIIIGTPTYWGNIPGTLKTVFDRMVYGMMREDSYARPHPLMKGKRAVVVATCSTPFPFNRLFRQSQGAVNALREILKWSGIRLTCTIQQGGTRGHTGLTGRDRTRCRRIIKRLIH